MTESDVFQSATSYLERPRNNPDELKQELCSNSNRLIEQLHVRYPFFPKDIALVAESQCLCASWPDAHAYRPCLTITAKSGQHLANPDQQRD